MTRLRCLLGSLLIVAIPAFATAQQDSVKVQDAWSRAAMASRMGVIYLTITDDSGPDRLTSVTSPVAAQASLHESFNDNGVEKMRAIPSLPVTPGKPVTLAPGGYHIMLMGLKQPLKQGDTFPVTLNFEKAGKVTTTVTVRGAGGSSQMGNMQHMQMKQP
jgi:copper(I)-binding protein